MGNELKQIGCSISNLLSFGSFANSPFHLCLVHIGQPMMSRKSIKVFENITRHNKIKKEALIDRWMDGRMDEWID